MDSIAKFVAFEMFMTASSLILLVFSVVCVCVTAERLMVIYNFLNIEFIAKRVVRMRHCITQFARVSVLDDLE